MTYRPISGLPATLWTDVLLFSGGLLTAFFALLLLVVLLLRLKRSCRLKPME